MSLPTYDAGSETVIAIHRPAGWLCSRCPFSMGGLSPRDQMTHFYGEHGTEYEKSLALQGFPGMFIPETNERNT